MIPAFANPDPGTAARCIDALAADPRFELRGETRRMLRVVVP